MTLCVSESFMSFPVCCDGECADDDDSGECDCDGRRTMHAVDSCEPAEPCGFEPMLDIHITQRD